MSPIVLLSTRPAIYITVVIIRFAYDYTYRYQTDMIWKSVLWVAVWVLDHLVKKYPFYFSGIDSWYPTWRSTVTITRIVSIYGNWGWGWSFLISVIITRIVSIYGDWGWGLIILDHMLAAFPNKVQLTSKVFGTGITFQKCCAQQFVSRNFAESVSMQDDFPILPVEYLSRISRNWYNSVNCVKQI